MDKAAIVRESDGTVAWWQLPADRYIVIGRDVYGKRFRIESDNFGYVGRINMWHGRIYLMRNGKRILVRTVTN